MRTSSSITNGVITGFMTAVPSEALGYSEKLLSVFVLAMVAELGRRFVISILEKKK